MAKASDKRLAAAHFKDPNALHANFSQVYGRTAQPFDLDSQEFRFTAIKPGTTTVNLNDRITQATWRDEGNQYNLNTIPVLQGTLNWVDDDPDVDPHPFRLEDGHSIRCEVKLFGSWTPLWQMRILKPPERTMEDGTATCELADDLTLAAHTPQDGYFHYRKSKRRPRGWRYDQIVADVCAKYKIPVAQMATGTAWITSLDLGLVSPLEVIRQAVLKEQMFTGRRHLIAWRWEDAKKRFALHILPAQRNPILEHFKDEMRNVTSSPVRRANLATSLVVHGHGRKPKHGRAVRYEPVRVSAPEAVRQYGFIERHVDYPGAAPGRGALADYAKRELALQLQPVKALSNFITTGIANVRRGDAVHVELPTEGYTSGNAGIVFVTTVEHTLTPTDYTMQLTLQNIDPLDPIKIVEERQAALKARKHRERSKHAKGKK